MNPTNYYKQVWQSSGRIVIAEKWEQFPYLNLKQTVRDLKPNSRKRVIPITSTNDRPSGSLWQRLVAKVKSFFRGFRS